MRIRVLAWMGFRSLIERKLRSILTIGGVTIGIGSIVYLLSLGYGLQAMTVNRIATLPALYQFEVTTGKSAILRLNDESLGNIGQVPNIAKTLPSAQVAGKAKYNSSQTDIVTIGANHDFMDLAEINPDVGKHFEDNKKNDALVTTQLLDLVGLKNYNEAIGKILTVNYVLSKAVLPPGKDATEVADQQVTITGFITDSQSAIVYVPLDYLKERTGLAAYSNVRVQVKDKNKVEETRKIVENLGFKTTYVGDTVAEINTIFSLFRFVLGGFGVIALFVAALGMFNTLTVSLLERTREVGIMKSMGVRNKDIRFIFLSEAFLMSTLGGLMGIALGVGLGYGSNAILNMIARSSGNQSVNIFSTPSTLVIAISIFAVIIGILTGIYPATRATRINPLDALRYE